MIILVILLVLPTLGGLTWWADSVRRYGLDRDTRDSARSWLGILGWLELVHAVGLAAWQITEFQSWGITPGSVLWLIANLLMISALFATGRAALQVSRHDRNEELSLQDLTRRDSEHSRLTMGLILLVGLPLLLPGSLAMMVMPGILGANFAFFTTIRHSRENRLLWTLALAARNGMSFDSEVDMMAIGEKRAWGRRLRSLAASLGHGTPLSQALLGGGRLLPAEIAAAIHAAERQGTVAEMLPLLAMRHSRRLRWFREDNSLNNTAIYVWAVTSVFLAISSFIIYYIVPKYKAIFNDFEIELPRITLNFLDAADYVVSYWFIVIPFLFSPFFILFGLLAICAGGARYVPGIVHSLWPRLATPSILRSLSAAVDREASSSELLETLADTAPNWQLMSRYDRLRRRLDGGVPIADALLDEGIVNGREAEALRHAGRIGHLGWSLDAIANRLDESRLRRLRGTVEFVKPLAIIAMGAFVLVFCLAMFLPLVQLLNKLA